MTSTQLDAIQAPVVPPEYAVDNPERDLSNQPVTIQLMSHDPCLVNVIRNQTDVVQANIAYLLNVPATDLTIIPPVVDGVVGLLQMKSHHKAKKATSLLAVRHCLNAALLHEL